MTRVVIKIHMKFYYWMGGPLGIANMVLQEDLIISPYRGGGVDTKYAH